MACRNMGKIPLELSANILWKLAHDFRIFAINLSQKVQEIKPLFGWTFWDNLPGFAREFCQDLPENLGKIWAEIWDNFGDISWGFWEKILRNFACECWLFERGHVLKK